MLTFYPVWYYVRIRREFSRLPSSPYLLAVAIWLCVHSSRPLGVGNLVLRKYSDVYVL